MQHDSLVWDTVHICSWNLVKGNSSSLNMNTVCANSLPVTWYLRMKVFLTYPKQNIQFGGTHAHSSFPFSLAFLSSTHHVLYRGQEWAQAVVLDGPQSPLSHLQPICLWSVCELVRPRQAWKSVGCLCCGGDLSQGNIGIYCNKGFLFVLAVLVPYFVFKKSVNKVNTNTLLFWKCLSKRNFCCDECCYLDWCAQITEDREKWRREISPLTFKNCL